MSESNSQFENGQGNNLELKKSGEELKQTVKEGVTGMIQASENSSEIEKISAVIIDIKIERK